MDNLDYYNCVWSCTKYGALIDCKSYFISTSTYKAYVISKLQGLHCINFYRL